VFDASLFERLPGSLESTRPVKRDRFPLSVKDNLLRDWMNRLKNELQQAFPCALPPELLKNSHPLYFGAARGDESDSGRAYHFTAILDDELDGYFIKAVILLAFVYVLLFDKDFPADRHCQLEFPGGFNR
jgi:hypothetical protein